MARSNPASWGLKIPGRPPTPSEGYAQQYDRIGPAGTQKLWTFDNGTCLTYGPDDLVDEFDPVMHPFCNQVALIDTMIRETRVVRGRYEGSGRPKPVKGSNAANEKDEEDPFDDFRTQLLDPHILPRVTLESGTYIQTPSRYASVSNLVSVYSTINKSDTPGTSHRGLTNDTRFGLTSKPGFNHGEHHPGPSQFLDSRVATLLEESGRGGRRRARRGNRNEIPRLRDRPTNHQLHHSHNRGGRGGGIGQFHSHLSNRGRGKAQLKGGPHQHQRFQSQIASVDDTPMPHSVVPVPNVRPVPIPTVQAPSLPVSVSVPVQFPFPTVPLYHGFQFPTTFPTGFPAGFEDEGPSSSTPANSFMGNVFPLRPVNPPPSSSTPVNSFMGNVFPLRPVNPPPMAQPAVVDGRLFWAGQAYKRDESEHAPAGPSTQDFWRGVPTATLQQHLNPRTNAADWDLLASRGEVPQMPRPRDFKLPSYGIAQEERLPKTPSPGASEASTDFSFGGETPYARQPKYDDPNAPEVIATLSQHDQFLHHMNTERLKNGALCMTATDYENAVRNAHNPAIYNDMAKGFKDGIPLTLPPQSRENTPSPNPRHKREESDEWVSMRSQSHTARKDNTGSVIFDIPNQSPYPNAFMLELLRVAQPKKDQIGMSSSTRGPTPLEDQSGRASEPPRRPPTLLFPTAPTQGANKAKQNNPFKFSQQSNTIFGEVPGRISRDPSPAMGSLRRRLFEQ